MALIVTLILGGIIGWAASVVMNRDAEQGVFENVVVGIVGAFLGTLLANLLGQSTGGTWTIDFTFADIFWAFVGAVVACGLWNLATRKRVR
jgi:uncharacterized membrane protein YeaQ/YmgE (transglycosylase-associated protein family)